MIFRDQHPLSPDCVVDSAMVYAKACSLFSETMLHYVEGCIIQRNGVSRCCEGRNGVASRTRGYLRQLKMQRTTPQDPHPHSPLVQPHSALFSIQSAIIKLPATILSGAFSGQGQEFEVWICI